MSNVQSIQQPFDMNLRVSQFVELRDKIKAIKERHEAELVPYQAAKEKLEALMLGYLQSVKTNNMATDSGTAYVSTRVSATIKDGEAFWKFVKEHELFDLMDKRANAPAITDYITTHGQPPPGVNYSTMLVLGVRRA